MSIGGRPPATIQSRPGVRWVTGHVVAETAKPALLAGRAAIDIGAG
jgi:hypothetical protein